MKDQYTPKATVERPVTRGPAREQAILDAAVALVAEIGYEHVTVDAIAARAHASKATMYRKWPGKAELVAEALRRHAEGDVTQLPDTGSLKGDLMVAVSAISATFAAANGGPSLIRLVEAIRADDVLRDLIRSQIDERGTQDGQLICQRARARGEIVAMDRGPAALNLAVAHVFLRSLLEGSPPTADERLVFVDQILLPLITRSTT